MPKLLRQMRHRTSQVRDLVFIRDPIYRKSTKTTKSGGTLAGPAVNFGYEENLSTARTEGSDAAYHADSPELILPGLKCLQSPVISRSGELERTGHRITGACTFYAPSLDYILALDNYDKLIDIERIIYTATDYSATSTSHTIKTFDDKSAGYQLDRLQFKIKSGTTLTKIALSGNEGGTTKSLTWSGSLALWCIHL